MEWSEHDPRACDYAGKSDHKSKLAEKRIVIWAADSLCTGDVETEHGYHVMFSARIILPVGELRPGGMIGPGDDWPKDWKWLLAPSPGA